MFHDKKIRALGATHFRKPPNGKKQNRFATSLVHKKGFSRSARFDFKKHLVDITVSPWAGIGQSKQSKWWYFMCPGSEFPFRFDYSYIYILCCII